MALTQLMGPTAITTKAAIWEKRYERRLFATDAVTVIVSVFAAQFLRFGIDSAEVEVMPTDRSDLQLGYTPLSIALILTWIIGLTWYDTRSPRVVGIGPQEYKRVITATLMVFGLLAILAFALRSQVGRGYVLIALPLGLALLLLGRWLWRKQLHRRREKRVNVYRTLVIGDRIKSEVVANEILRNQYSGLDIVGAVTEHGTNVELLPGIPVVADYDEIIRTVDRLHVDTIILTSADALTPDRLREIGWQLENRDVDLVASIAITGIAGPRIHSRPVSGLPLVHLEVPTFRGRKYYTKRAFDILGSAFALLVTSPIALVVAALIRMEGPGPILFKQQRIGVDGKPFTMLKFRSMVVDAESRKADLLSQNEHDGVLFKMKNDPRITRVGAFIRKHSIDEFPQFINVFRGDMSMVGPRPPLPDEVVEYERHVHRRFLVKPGVTGLWQVNGRSDLSWEDSVRLDLYYVENWSLLDDLLIVLRTVRLVVAPKGAY